MICSRKCFYTFLSLAFTLVCLLYMLNGHYKYFTFNGPLEDGKTEKEFTVMTFNVNALDDAQLYNTKLIELIEFVKHETPDILCLQELSPLNYQTIKGQLDSIYGGSIDNEVKLNGFRIYSRFPIRHILDYRCQGEIETDDFDSLSLADYKNIQIVLPMRSAELEVAPGRWVTVFSGHLRSSAYSTARRSMDKGTSWLGGVPLYWRNYKIGKRIRDFEAQNVRGFIDDARSAGMPVIVAGDLNDWCGSDCLETLMGNDLKDAWWEGGRGFGWTYFGWHLRLRIDHILYSDELQLTDVRVVDSDLSDHKPLKATFSWKEQNND